MRHDGRAGGKSVGDIDKTEVLAHPQNQLFAEAADMHHRQRGGCGKFNRKIAVAHGIQAVLADLRLAVVIDHAQRGGDAFAVQRVAGAGQRGSAQRQAIHAAAHFQHALGVAAEHFDVSEHVVAKADRLGDLQMREAGQDDFDVFLGNIDQRFLQVGEQAADEVDFAAQPQAHVGGDLVVARAARVQALAGVAHELGQARLDVQMHVFEVELPFERAGFDLGGDLRHAGFDGFVVGAGDDALRGEHVGVGQRAGDVGQPQALVKKHAGGVAFDQVAHRFGEQGRPGLGFFVELVHRGLSGEAGTGRGGWCNSCRFDFICAQNAADRCPAGGRFTDRSGATIARSNCRNWPFVAGCFARH